FKPFPRHPYPGNTKGNLFRLTDSSMVLISHKDTVDIPYVRIDHIRTRHTVGHTVLWTSAVTGVAGAVSLYSLDDMFNHFSITRSDPAALLLAGFLAGAAEGAAIGTLFGFLKHSIILHIDGDREKWLHAKEILEPLIRKRSS